MRPLRRTEANSRQGRPLHLALLGGQHQELLIAAAGDHHRRHLLVLLQVDEVDDGDAPRLARFIGQLVGLDLVDLPRSVKKRRLSWVSATMHVADGVALPVGAPILPRPPRRCAR